MRNITHLIAKHRSWLNVTNGMLVLLFAVAFGLATHNLAYYPTTWFDEGWFLQIPKNLVQHGEYATYSSEGFRHYDTVIGTAPVFYLPIAAVFQIWGVGLVQARMVIVAYFLATGLLTYLVTRKLFGVSAALVALALFLLVQVDDHSTSALLMGRQVMGEVPALCFFMAGLLFWLKAFEQQTNRMLVVAGILLGLAMGTKSQFLLLVPPTIVTVALIDRLYYGEKRYRFFTIPLLMCFAMLVARYFFIWVILGSDNFSRYIEALFVASGPQVRVFFAPAAMQTALKFFLRSDFMIWIIPSLVYVLLLCAKKHPDNIKCCFPLVFVTGWLTWFLIASAGWSRYAFPALAVSYVLVARLIDDLGGFASLSLQRIWAALRHWDLASIARPMSALFLFIMLLINASQDAIQGIVAAPDQSAQQLAAYIDMHIDDDELIETWEWQIAFLADDALFHHPPNSLLPQLLARKSMDMPYDHRTYDFQQYRPSYILVGWFGKWIEPYPPEFFDQEATLVTSIGDYDLYKVNEYVGATGTSE